MKLSRNTCWGLYSLAVSPGKSNRVASVLQHLEALTILAALPPTYTWHRIQEVLDTVRHGGAPPSDLLPLLLTAITRELEPVDASSELLSLPPDLLSNILSRVGPALSLLISSYTCAMTLPLVTHLTLTPPHHHLLQYARALTSLSISFSRYQPTFLPQSDILEALTRMSLHSLTITGNTDLSAGDVVRVGSLTSLRYLVLPGTTFPPSSLSVFAALPALESLDLSETSANDDSCASLPNLPMLSRLSLRGCNVSYAGLQHVSRLQSLRDLDMQSTCSLDSVDQAFANCLSHVTRLAANSDGHWSPVLARILALPHLQALELSPQAVMSVANASVWPINSTPDLRVEVFQALSAKSGLRSLDISGYFAVLGPASAHLLAGLSHLHTLSIMLPYDQQVFKALSELTTLTYLNLHSVYGCSPHTNFTLEALTALPSLATLKVRGIKSGLELACLQDMPALKSLAVNDVLHLSDPGLAVIAELVRTLRISSLSLAGCEGIGDLGLPFLSDLHSLTHLDLAHTFIRGPGLRHLSGLQGLVELNLGQNTILPCAMRHLLPIAASTAVVIDCPPATGHPSSSPSRPVSGLARWQGLAATESASKSSLPQALLRANDPFRRSPSRALGLSSLV